MAPLVNLRCVDHVVPQTVSSGAEVREAPGGDYNVLPYPSLAYGFTQPVHLAALAALHGIDAPDVRRARVLEIGCAAGGNIIPLAVRFPQASFLGVDLSTRHVADGQRRIAALGINNIELRQADVTSLSFSGQAFDYIICHGVFSWVPKAAQEAILRLCGESLAGNGVALISYNVLPGWHLRSAVRDICLHHAGRDGTPLQRVARARKALEQIAQEASESEPYGQLLRQEAQRLVQRPAAYILGEFLVESNTALHFQDFSVWAQRHGLGYLCDADLASSAPGIANPDIAGRVRALSGSGTDAFEQNVDFITGRTFRRSLLVKNPTAGAARSAEPQRFRSLHFAAQLQRDTAQSSAQLSVYKDKRGRAIRAEDAAVRHALARLAQGYPSTLSLGELAESATDAEKRVCEALFLLTACGQVNVFSLPLAVGRAGSERPRAWALARAEAASGQAWVSSMLHACIAINPVVALLLPHVDGRNDRAALAVRLSAALQQKALTVPELREQEAPWPEAGIHEIAMRYVQRTIDFLAVHALLEADAVMVQQDETA